MYLLQQAIEHAAERTPEKEAFRFRDSSVTYAELLKRSQALAATLRAHGVRQGDRVGIYAHKGLECAESIYGVLLAGAAYVPLDPAMPPSRLSFILGDAEIRHLVTQETRRKTLVEVLAGGAELELLVGLEPHDDLKPPTLTWENVYTNAPTYEPSCGVESDLAYIMYTSGSTGEPKGIMHTHRSGLAYAKLAVDVYDVSSADRLSNFAPLHFDQSTFDYFSGPIAGATTVILPEEYTKFPASLSQLIADERVTIWYSVPFALIQLLLRGVLEQRDLSALRWVLFGGEPFPPKYLRRLMEVLPDARFSNVYGPAEVNQCTYFHVPTLAEDSDEPVPIGRIWENTEGLVVDDSDVPVSSGEIGELLIRSPTMMDGYWSRSDLNAAAFYYREADGGRQDVFYRTGDLVEERADGELLFMGRKDRQVKTRGYRVELDEVEAAILSFAGVEETAVFTVAGGGGENRIEAAVICQNGAATDESSLRSHLVKRLARYAVPERIVFLTAFPRTPTGKIDRRTLKEQLLNSWSDTQDART